MEAVKDRLDSGVVWWWQFLKLDSLGQITQGVSAVVLSPLAQGATVLTYLTP